MKKLILLLLPLLIFAKPKFNDSELKSMTPRYFQRNHSAPKLLGVNIYKQGRAVFIRWIFVQTVIVPMKIWALLIQRLPIWGNMLKRNSANLL